MRVGRSHCTPSTHTHTYAHFYQPATAQATEPKAVLEQKGVGRRREGKTNESSLLSPHRKLCSTQERSRPGGKGTRGKSWLAPRFQQGHCCGDRRRAGAIHLGRGRRPGLLPRDSRGVMNPGASQALLKPHLAKIEDWGGRGSRVGGNT